MQSSQGRTNPQSFKDKIGVLIGLFCTWALSPDVYSLISETVGRAKVVKVDVPPPPANIFVVYTEDRVFEIPLDRVRRFIMPSCNVCFDMTNEFSDISVGAVEGEKNWNTVIVRTKIGQELLQVAHDAGVLEVNPLERERLKHLCEVSLMRKRRVLTEKDSDKVGYLLTLDEDKSRIIGEQEIH
jgi:coenzyme F420 hydrogenase subunit beta